LLAKKKPAVVHVLVVGLPAEQLLLEGRLSAGLHQPLGLFLAIAGEDAL
jgi:hypothetical protein